MTGFDLNLKICNIKFFYQHMIVQNNYNNIFSYLKLTKIQFCNMNIIDFKLVPLKINFLIFFFVN